VVRERVTKPRGTSPQPPIRPHLESSVVLVKDLAEQPPSKYILLVGAAENRRPSYYAVDDYLSSDNVIRFFQGHGRDSKLVYACRVTEGQWALAARDAVDVVTEKEFHQFNTLDAKATKRYFQESDPKAFEAAERMAQQLGLAVIDPSGAVQAPAPHGKADDGKPGPGQYL